MTDQLNTDVTVTGQGGGSDAKKVDVVSQDNKTHTDVIGSGDKPVPDDVKTTWPDNWRELIAGEDEKMKKHLERYGSLSDIAKSNVEFRDRMAKGEYRRVTQPPVEDEVAMKEWRAENGVPESADKYTTPEGVLFGENDQPIVNEFLKDMHKNNVPDAFVQPALKWYSDLQQKQLEQEVAIDKQIAIATEESLRSQLGSEYRSAYNEVQNYLSNGLPEDVANALMSQPDTFMWALSQSRQINPAVTMFPYSQNPSQSVDDEIASIEKKIGTDEYSKDVKMQERYRKLLEVKMKQR